MAALLGVVPAFDFLAGRARAELPAVCVVFGDDEFLKRLALEQIQRLLADEDPDAAPSTIFSEENAKWVNVRDALATRSLFGGARRVVRIDDVDKLLKERERDDDAPASKKGNRELSWKERLEEYLESPLDSGILILVATTFASNTRLYKAVDKSGLAIDCRLPKPAGKKEGVDAPRVVRWIVLWAEESHKLRLAPAAAERLLDLTENRLGIVDQHLAKLALLAKPGQPIDADFVQEVVGGWKAKNMWELLDAAVEGNSAEALRHVGKLLDSGEKPIALMGQLAWALRRFHAAGRIVEQDERRGKRMDLLGALQRAGFKDWPKGTMQRAESAMKQLGRMRTGKLYRQLLALDLSLKGTHSNDERGREALELFFLSLDRTADPRKAKK